MIEENKETIVIVNPLSKKWSTVLLQITMKLREAIRSQNSRWCTLGLKVRSLQKKNQARSLKSCSENNQYTHIALRTA